MPKPTRDHLSVAASDRRRPGNLPVSRTAYLAAAAGITFIVAGAPAAEARELRIELITPPPHVWTQVANRMAENLPAASGDTLRMVVFPAAQLGSEQEMFRQLGVGLLDAALMTGAVTSLRAPSMAGCGLRFPRCARRS